ncbi:cobalamin biosynthesis protein [Natronospirillum operosum]|uniref:Cobalamin biosynthesis protein CobD n=1 Tax=Natronospirillum operosum TaxID=2759953 RepID=A0A4Z0WDV3_9GAMM|nr:cobalamin biosynthesis protein [Natronospirillum operosum]
MTLLLIVIGALLLDQWLGEPRRAHPLVAFGHAAHWLEARLNRADPKRGRRAGLLALALAVLPLTALAAGLDYGLRAWPLVHGVVSVLILWLAIGRRSLLLHAARVARPLQQGDLTAARAAVAMLVSRDTAELDSAGVARATTESVLENGADALFSALFWYLVAGLPGVVLYRLANTLDAMWGYRTPRHDRFGWAAARFDDLLNLVPARLTALGYALAGSTPSAVRRALHCWRSQGSVWKSPNAGPVMAAGAGALNVSLGGGAPYHGQWQERPRLGPADCPAEATHIEQACRLVDRTLLIWLAALGILWAILTLI